MFSFLVIVVWVKILSDELIRNFRDRYQHQSVQCLLHSQVCLTFTSSVWSQKQNSLADDVLVDILEDSLSVFGLLQHHRLLGTRCTRKNKIILTQRQWFCAARFLQRAHREFSTKTNSEDCTKITQFRFQLPSLSTQRRTFCSKCNKFHWRQKIFFTINFLDLIFHCCHF